MERRLKERLTGAVVLMLLAVIFIPMVLDNSSRQDIDITRTNIPPAPDIDFKSDMVQVEELATIEPSQLPLEPLPSAVTIAESDTPAATPETAPVSGSDTNGIQMQTGPVAIAPNTTEFAPVIASKQEQSTDVTDATSAKADTAPVPVQVPPADTSARSMSAWVIQLGSFSSRENADSLVRRLQTNGFPGYVEQAKSGTDIVFKVRVGPELSRAQAETIQKNLKTRLKLDAIILRFP